MKKRFQQILFLLVFVLAFSQMALAQEDPHAGCIGAPPMVIPPDVLERPVWLRTGIGNSQEKVTTTSAEALAFYNQGLNYLESCFAPP